MPKVLEFACCRLGGYTSLIMIRGVKCRYFKIYDRCCIALLKSMLGGTALQGYYAVLSSSTKKNIFMKLS